MSTPLAHRKNWRVLTKLRLSARYATTLLRARLLPTPTEVARRLTIQ
ncbi:hypothetical protein ACFY0P_26030 [Streptomyces sp. NPDC001714]